MILFLLQAVVLIAACLGLLRLWRASQPSERWLQLVVAAGFLGRAVAAQILFWISWAGLPIARSLQLGRGLWFFAQDASVYYPAALQAASRGLWGIITYDRSSQSVMYTQTLATAIWLIGSPASVAVLLNLFCYLGMVAILLHWSRVEPRTRPAAAVAIVAISLSPAFVLWSTQPLKDTYFQFLFVAFIAACASWQRAWATPGHTAMRVASGVGMFCFLFALAAIRWYFGFVLLGVTSLFLLFVAFQSSGRKLATAMMALVLVLLLSRGLVVGAGPYLPTQIADVLTPRSARAVQALPSSLLGNVENARQSFDRAGGRTAIQSGRAEGADAPPPPSVQADEPVSAPLPSPPPPPPGPPLSAADLKSARLTLELQATAWNRGDIEGFLRYYWNSPELETAIGPDSWRGWNAYADFLRKNFAPSAMGIMELGGIHVEGRDSTANASGKWLITKRTSTTRGAFTATLRHLPDGTWTIVRYASTQPEVIVTPTSRVQRMLTGTAALILPQRLGEWLGIFHIGGGRGMLWFTEFDTIIFDAVLFLALAALFVHRRILLRNPLTWLVVLITLAIGVPLAYSISNFGTLFRLREMIYLGLVLVPVVVVTGVRPSQP